MTLFVSHKPRGPLADLVDSIWLYEAPRPAHSSERRLPTGDVELVVDLDADRRSGSGVVVAGPFTRPFVLDAARQCQTIGVVFRLGGAAALLGLPLEELRNRHVPLAELWGSHALELRERAIAARTPSAKLGAVERVLSARLRGISAPPVPVAAAAAARIAAAPERCGIAELSAGFGLSTRRLEQVFRTEVGVTPKGYQRLQRFRRALSRIDDAARVGWAEFALEHGYYDQSHLIREFHAHSGGTPSAYVEARCAFPNHVAMPA